MSEIRNISPAAAQHASGEEAEGPVGQYVVADSNRWSRVVLNFRDVTPNAWCELSFQIEWHPEEESRSVTDFASIGIDFLTNDGSSIDFTYVPGLTRTQIDPHSHTIAGPDYHGPGGDLARTGKVHCSFLVPSPTRHLIVTIRSWRNSQPFKIHSPMLCQLSQSESEGGSGEEQADASVRIEHEFSSNSHRTWRTLTSEPQWFSHALVPGRRIFIRGQIVNQDLDSDGALARIVFRDAQGEELSPPYPDMLFAPGIGAAIKIPTHRQTRRFTLDLMPPPKAATVDLGFQAWRDEALMQLVLPLEVSLEDDLLLETIAGEDTLDTVSFLGRLMERLGAPLQATGAETGTERTTALLSLLDLEAVAAPITIHDRVRLVQRGEKKELVSDQLSLGTFPAWTIPAEPTWTEDPFRSPAWRMDFQSLSWLLALANDPTRFPYALDLALSWSKANPLGTPSDVLGAHPVPMAARAEVFLQLLSLAARSKQKIDDGSILSLFAEAVRHCFVLSQIVGQNVLSHSISQLHAACALLALAKGIPRIPLASYWISIALAHLRDGFEILTGPGGSTIEQSQHYRLETLSLGLILLSTLGDAPETLEFRKGLAPHLRDGLRAVIATTDPGGMLPSFGDGLHGCHHASWIRRLLTGYGQSLMADEEIASELAYPDGPRTFVLPDAGVAVARNYRRRPDWSYLCASFNEQRHAQGHLDCTSFVYAAGGVRWITDPGGSGFHETGAARQYLISSRAHNVAIPDGREQTAGRGWVQSTRVAAGANIFEIGSNVYGPHYTHRRIIVCLSELNAIAVFDRFTTAQRPVTFQGFLHLDHSIAAALVNPKLVVGFKDKSRLRIIPRTVAGSFNGITIETGINDRPSSVQGFVSLSPGSLRPANVVCYRFSGQGTVCGGAILAVDEAGLKAMAQLLDAAEIRDLLERAPNS